MNRFNEQATHQIPTMPRMTQQEWETTTAAYLQLIHDVEQEFHKQEKIVRSALSRRNSNGFDPHEKNDLIELQKQLNEILVPRKHYERILLRKPHVSELIASLLSPTSTPLPSTWSEATQLYMSTLSEVLFALKMQKEFLLRSVSFVSQKTRYDRPSLIEYELDEDKFRSNMYSFDRSYFMLTTCMDTMLQF